MFPAEGVLFLVKVKQKMPEEKKKEVVYQVPCKDCCKVYIGETKRTLKTRISEHKQAVKKGNEKNGIAVHAHTTNHNIGGSMGSWDSTRLLEEENNGSNPDPC